MTESTDGNRIDVRRAAGRTTQVVMARLLTGFQMDGSLVSWFEPCLQTAYFYTFHIHLGCGHVYKRIWSQIDNLDPLLERKGFFTLSQLPTDDSGYTSLAFQCGYHCKLKHSIQLTRGAIVWMLVATFVKRSLSAHIMDRQGGIYLSAGQLYSGSWYAVRCKRAICNFGLLRKVVVRPPPFSRHHRHQSNPHAWPS